MVRRFYHLILLRQVDPKLKAARFGLARFVDGHFSMDNCEITLSMDFDWELLHSRHLLPRPCHWRRLLLWLVWRREYRRGTYRAHPLHATFLNDTRMSCRVFVFAGTVSNVGDCSLTAMWVVGETLQITQRMHTTMSDIEHRQERISDHVLHPWKYGSGRA